MPTADQIQKDIEQRIADIDAERTQLVVARDALKGKGTAARATKPRTYKRRTKPSGVKNLDKKG